MNTQQRPLGQYRFMGSGWLCTAVCSLVALHSTTALAASLNVKIRQLDHAGEAKAAICKELKKCDVPLDIQTAQGKKAVTVQVEFFKGSGLRLEFQTPKGYLYARDKNPADAIRGMYETIWHTDVGKVKSPYSVSLFLPAVPNPITAPLLNKANEPIADLEITAEVVK